MKFRQSRGKIYVLLVILLSASFLTVIEWTVILIFYWLKFFEPGIYPIWFPQLMLFMINLWLVEYVSSTDKET